MRALGEWLLQKRNHALLAVVVCMLASTLIPFVGWIGAVIMCLVTLRKGPKEGAFLVIWLILPNVVSLLRGEDMTVLWDFVTQALCVWLLACVLRQTQSWRVAIELGTVLTLIAVLGVYFAYPDLEQWWFVHLSAFYQQNSDVLFSNMPKELLVNLAKNVAPYMTSIQALVILSSGLTNLLLARWWQAILFNPGGLRRELHALRVGHVMLGLLVGVGVLLLLRQPWGWVLLPVALFPVFLVGLSVIHSVLAHVPATWFWLGAFYGVLIVFFPYVAGIVMLIAIVDKWVDFRSRGKHNGSHLTNKNS